MLYYVESENYEATHCVFYPSYYYFLFMYTTVLATVIHRNMKEISLF